LPHGEKISRTQERTSTCMSGDGGQTVREMRKEEPYQDKGKEETAE